MRLYQGKPESERQLYRLWDYLALSCYKGMVFFKKSVFLTGLAHKEFLAGSVNSCREMLILYLMFVLSAPYQSILLLYK